ncbi:unnamed protein product [Phytomonas sp. Hart1]|nr:unnamed protein product [Phytomonas sp. Hart1]|eukprot:CCW68357.1 unnamed protein product [Phytomonas sp. isolate Hart1]
MRGFLKRQNVDKVQPGSNITTYEEALYPPRPYRYHLQQDPIAPSISSTAQLSSNDPHSVFLPPPLVVLPSIDADSICEPHLQQPQPQQLHQTRRPMGTTSGSSASSGTVVNKRPPPFLSKFFDCFVPSSLMMDERGLFDVLGGPQSIWCEPLNIFHYPDLLFNSPSPSQDEIKPPVGGSVARKRVVRNQTDSSVTIERRQMALLGLAEMARVPLELRSFVTALGTGGMMELRPVSGKDRGKMEAVNVLRIRPSRRPQPPRPIRRGAKVVLDTGHLATSTGTRVASDDKVKKSTTDAGVVGKKRTRNGEDGTEADNLVDLEHDNESEDSKNSANMEEDDDDDVDNLSDGFFEADDDDYGDNIKDGFNDDNGNDFF